jgi:hypothetical protein
LKTQKIKFLLAITLLVVGIASVILYSINTILDNVYLKKDSAYTISEEVSMGSGSKAGNESKYTFFLDGKWYAGFTNLPLHWDGTKYFIRFYPKNPNRNQATTVIADSLDIKNLPIGGYKKLPHK